MNVFDRLRFVGAPFVRLLNRNKPDKGHFVVPCFILKLTFCRGGYYPPVLITLSLLAADSRPYGEVLGETR